MSVLILTWHILLLQGVQGLEAAVRTFVFSTMVTVSRDDVITMFRAVFPHTPKGRGHL